MSVSVNELFISYSVADKAFVERLAADLHARDITAWVGHINLRGGQTWPSTIEKAIDQAQAVLVVWTPDAKKSQYVQKEYGYAIEQNKRVIPLILKPCKLTMLLHDLQWMDFTRTQNYPNQFNALVDLLTSSENVLLSPQTFPTVLPRPLSVLTIATLVIVIAGLGFLFSVHGTKQSSTHTMQTAPVMLTATTSTTITVDSTITMTAIAGSTGGATETGSHATPTRVTLLPTSASTKVPTATPTPTIAPTATPTRSPQ